MRVLFIATAYPSHPDDARGAHVHALARSLFESGCLVTVVAPSAPGARAQERVDGVEIRRFRYWFERHQALAVGVGGIIPNLRQRPQLVIQVLPFLVGLVIAVVRHSRRHDVIHAHWLVPSGLAALVARWFWSIPVVATSHGGEVNLARPDSVLARMIAFTANHVNACTAVSKALCVRLTAMGVVNPVFVPLGVKVREGPNRFEGTAGDRSVLHVLYVGSLIPRKSISTLLEALHLLRRRGVETAAAIVGDGPDRRTLEELAKHHRLEVRFIGEVPHREVGAWMERADVLVLPSTAEGRPVVVLEAMAASLPVVVSDIDGSRELIDDGRTGYLFPPGDADKLADFLEILSDVEVRKHLAASALQFVNDSGLSDVAAAKRFLELYLLLDTKYVAKINV